MKKFLVLLALTTSFSFNTIAGSLLNSATDEAVEFKFDQKTGEIEISSTAGSVMNKRLVLESVKAEKSSIQMFGATKFIIKESCHESTVSNKVCIAATYLIPSYNVPVLAAGAIDVLALPIKAPIKYLLNKRNQRDLNSLMVAASTDEVVNVSNAKFKRIVKLLE